MTRRIVRKKGGATTGGLKMNRGSKLSTKQWVTLGLLAALVLIMSSTPLGTLPLGPLSITLNMIPVAIAAIAVGPVGGCIIGAVFGTYSFLQAMGIGVPSGMGILTFGISPVLTFVQRFVSRAVTGLLLGYIFRGIRKLINTPVAVFSTGFCAAILNFIFFMGLLAVCFGNSPEFGVFLHDKLGKATMTAYIVGTFLSNTIFEITVTTLLTGLVGLGLFKAKLIDVTETK